MKLERWVTFSKREQLLMIGSEIMRANVWQRKDDEKFLGALERGMHLIKLCQLDEKWQNAKAMLAGLQEEFQKFSTKSRVDDTSVLYRAL